MCLMQLGEKGGSEKFYIRQWNPCLPNHMMQANQM